MAPNPTDQQEWINAIQKAKPAHPPATPPNPNVSSKNGKMSHPFVGLDQSETTIVVYYSDFG